MKKKQIRCPYCCGHGRVICTNCSDQPNGRCVLGRGECVFPGGLEPCPVCSRCNECPLEPGSGGVDPDDALAKLFGGEV